MKHQHNQRVHLTHPKFLTTTWLLSTLTLYMWATLAWAIDIPPAWRDALQDTGTARVIVVLNIPVQPEGTLNDADAIVAQRADIAQAQQLFLDSLQPQGSAETRLETIPALVMVADSQTLTQLQENPLVASLQLDAADETMAGQTIADQLKELERVYESSHSYAQVTAVTVSPASAQEGDVRELMVANLQSVGITVARGEESASGRQVRAANPGTPVAPCGGVTAGLVLCLPLDGDAKDYSGNGNDGIIDGPTLTTDRFGTPNHAFYFSGTGSNRIRVPNSPSLNFGTGDFSTAFWINTGTGNERYSTIIDKRTGTSASAVRGYAIYHSWGNLGIQLTTGTPINYGESFPIGVNAWKFVVVTVVRDQSNGGKMYVDGTLVQTFNPTGHWSSLDNTADLFIGGNVLVPTNYMLQGKLDDIRIYNRVLSVTEIQQLYRIVPDVEPPKCDGITNGLVACYPLDDNALDGSGNGNHGIIDGPTLTTDRFGTPNHAFSFSGTGSNRIRVPNSPSLNFGTSDFSTAFWVNTGAGNETYSTIIDKRTGTSANARGYAIYHSWGKLGVQLATGAYSNYGESFPIGANVWKFVVVTVDRDQSNGGKMYVDGALVQTFNPTGRLSSIDNTADLFIGINALIHTNYMFKGKLDDIRIYNRAISEAEVKQLYELGTQPPKVTLTVTKTGTGQGQVASSDATLNCGTTCQADYAQNSTVTLTATPTTGNTFTQWSGACSGTTATTTVTLDQAKTCTATFDKVIPKYTLTVAKTGNGTGSITGTGITCGTDCTEDYTAKTLVTLTATPDTGSKLLSWGGDCSGTATTATVTMTAAKNCTANFVPANATTFTLTVAKTGKGQGTIRAQESGQKVSITCNATCATGSYDYPLNKVVTITAAPATGSTFKAWSCDGSYQKTGTPTLIKVTMDAAKTCTATFE